MFGIYKWVVGIVVALVGVAALAWWVIFDPFGADGAALTLPPAVQDVTSVTATDSPIAPRAHFGDGRGTHVVFGAQNSLMAVATDIGLYLYDATSLTRRQFWATTTPVQSVAVAADNPTLAFSTTGDERKLYQYRDGDTKLMVRDLEESLIHGLSYSPDGAYLVGVSFYHLFMWDAATLDLLVTHQQPSALTKDIRFSPDGRLLAVVYKQTLELWRLADRSLVQTVQLDGEHYFSSETVTFAPDSQQIAVAALREPRLYRWTVASNQLSAAPILQLDANTGAIIDLQFDPTGDQLSVAAASGQFFLYDLVATDSTLTALPLSGIQKIAWSSDGAWLAAAGSNGAIHILSVVDGAQKQSVMLPPYVARSYVEQLFWHANDDALTAILETGAVYQWQLADGTLTHNLEQHSLGRLNSVAFTPDGAQLIIGAENGVVQLWDVVGGQLVNTLHPPGGHVDAVVAAADNQLAIAASETLALGVWADPVYLWNATTDDPFTVLDTDDTGFVTSCGVYWNSALFSPDGQYVVTTAYAHKALLWRVTDGELVQQFEGHTSAILDIALSPDGALLATASDDEDVRVWRTADGQLEQTFSGHAGGAVAVAFAPDGQSLAARSAMGDIWLWPLDGDAPRQLLADVRNPRSNLVFSPDGTWLATGARNNRAYLWPVADPTQLYVLARHNGLVNAVTFSPDGALLATASDDGTVALWDVPAMR